MSEDLSDTQLAELSTKGCLSKDHLISLMYDTNALPECKPNTDGLVGFGQAVSLTTAKPLLKAIAMLRESALEADGVIDMLSLRLQQIAVALKGEPPVLTLWSWHDLPELVTALRAENERLKALTIGENQC